jgi:hypothetical protein
VWISVKPYTVLNFIEYDSKVVKILGFDFGEETGWPAAGVAH